MLFFAGFFGVIFPAKATLYNSTSSGQGDLAFESERRTIVRGNRGYASTPLIAYTPPGNLSIDVTHHHLLAFEREQLVLRHLDQQALEPWMSQLKLPDLPVRWHAKVLAYLDYFHNDPKGHALLAHWFANLQPYEARMRAILAEVGVPQDLLFVAMIESSFNPNARSSAGATGFWQFMDSASRVYGLKNTYWMDERRDIDKATYAAAAYFRDLHTRFGSWELSLAAFHAGYGLVMTSIRRHNSNNYWELCELESGLPFHTTNYVPKVVAIAIIAHNPQRFGFSQSTSRTQPWTEIYVDGAIALKDLAELLDEDPDTLTKLNAQYIRGRTPPEAPQQFPVRIPKHKLALFHQHAQEFSRKQKLATYEIRYGDTLEQLAQTLDMSKRELQKLNHIQDDAELQPGVLLMVPPQKSQRLQQPSKETDLLAAVPQISVASSQRQVFFRVTRATTPQGLSDIFQVGWDDIVQWNHLDPHARLQAGQVLQILIPKSFDLSQRRVVAYEVDEVKLLKRGSKEHIEAGLKQRGLQRRNYKVRRGDSLPKIAKKFNLSEGDLARINHFRLDHKPREGEVLIVYVAPKSSAKTAKKSAKKSAKKVKKN